MNYGTMIHFVQDNHTLSGISLPCLKWWGDTNKILNMHNLNWEVNTGHQGGVKFKYLMQFSKTQICYVHMHNGAKELYKEYIRLY